MRVLGVETFRPTCNSISALTSFPHNSIKTLTTTLFSSLSLYSNAASSSSSSSQQGRNGFAIKASRKPRKGNTNHPLPLDVEGFIDDEDEEDEDEEDEDEEGIVIPFEGMRKWIENKPSGFGQGKAYDTSIEDKLAEEIEQSRRAQLANINKLKHNPVNPNPKKEVKASEVQPSGIRVRLSNLPRKKNIQRDLQLAFKGFVGIVSVSPAVSGSKKTREPICKGFAFVYFKSEEVANRFIQTYSKQNLTFGKIQKQVTCEMVTTRESSESSEQENLAPKKIQKQQTSNVTNPSISLNSASKEELLAFSKQVMANLSKSLDSASGKEHPTFGKEIVAYKTASADEVLDSASRFAPEESYSSTPVIKIPNLEEIPESDSEDSLGSWEDTSFDEPLVLDDPSVSANWDENVEEGMEHSNPSRPNEDGEQTPILVTNTVSLGSENVSLSKRIDGGKERAASLTKADSVSSKEKPKNQTDKKKKKLTVKGKTEKTPKLNVPGSSSKRLKTREKTLLAGVLSRYGKEASMVTQK